VLSTRKCATANVTEMGTLDPLTNDTTFVEADSTTETDFTTATTDNEVAESVPYVAANSTSSSSITSKETTTSSTTAKPYHGQAALVYPTALAVIVPVCIRLFSTNLVGSV